MYEVRLKRETTVTSSVVLTGNACVHVSRHFLCSSSHAAGVYLSIMSCSPLYLEHLGEPLTCGNIGASSVFEPKCFHVLSFTIHSRQCVSVRD